MFDPTRSVLYRNFLLNDPTVIDQMDADTGIGKGITGCVIDSFDFSDVDIMQFLEKRSQQDGMDAGDVFKGARRLRVAGTLYGKTRALFYDAIFNLRAVLDPVLAQRESPADKGYLPLYFGVPTNRVSDYPTGGIDLRVLALPRAIQMVGQRDQLGGDDGDALAIPWQALFLMRDPTIMAQDPTDVDLSGGGTIASDFNNRGNYIAPLNMVIEVTSAAGSIVVTAGGATFTITVPASTGNRIIRYKGADKVLTFEESSVEVTRMDLITYDQVNTYPFIPPGASPYSVAFTGVTVVAGSHMYFWETYS